MIGYLIFGVCLVVALILAGRALVNVDPAKLANAIKWLFFGIAASISLFLMLTGRFAVGAMVGLFSLSLLRRWALPGLNFSLPKFGGGKRGGGQTSTVSTDYIRMTLDHGSGAMGGEVLQGTFAGRELGSLNLNQLLSLLRECETNDLEAAQLLETYLDRTAEGWREQAGGSAAENGGEHEPGRGWGRKSRPAGQMTLEEACEILGVAPGASEDEIKAAHHRLMLKNHPDRGGSSFLAAKINQAKDLLLN